MQNMVGDFTHGLLYAGQEVMHVVGLFDDSLSTAMTAFGLSNPVWQVYVLLVVCAALVVFALRAVGGLLGWCVLLLLVLLMLHRLVPNLGTPGEMPVTSQLNQAL